MASTGAAFSENGQKAPQRLLMDEYSELEKIVRLREVISSGQHAKYKPKPKVTTAAGNGGGLGISKPATPPVPPPVGAPPPLPPPPPPPSLPFRTQPIQVYPNNLNSDAMTVFPPVPPPPPPSQPPQPSPAQLAAQKRDLEIKKQNLQKMLQQRQHEQQLEREREARRLEMERQEKERMEREQERERLETERLERERFQREMEERIRREKEDKEKQERERLAQEQRDREQKQKEQDRIALEAQVQSGIDQELRDQERRRQQEQAARMLPQPFKRRSSSTAQNQNQPPIQIQTLTNKPPGIQQQQQAPSGAQDDKKVQALPLSLPLPPTPRKASAHVLAQSSVLPTKMTPQAVRAERQRLEAKLQVQLEEWRTRKMRSGEPVLDPSIDVGFLLEKANEILGGVLPSLPGSATKFEQPPFNPGQTPSNDDASTRPDESQRASSEGLYSPPEYIQPVDDPKPSTHGALPQPQEKKERRKSTGNRDGKKPFGADRHKGGDSGSRDFEITPRKTVATERAPFESSPRYSSPSSDAPSVGSTSSSVRKKRARPLDDDHKPRVASSSRRGGFEPEPPSAKRPVQPSTELPETIIIGDDDDNNNNNTTDKNRQGKSDGTWQRPTIPRSRMSPKPQIKREQAPDSPTMTIPRPTPTPEPPVVTRVEYLVGRPRYFPRGTDYYDIEPQRARYMAPPPGYEIVYRPIRRPEYDYPPHPYDYHYPPPPRNAYGGDPYYDPAYHPHRGPPPPQPAPSHGPPQAAPRPGSPSGVPLQQRFDSPPPPAHQARPSDLPHQGPPHQPPPPPHIPVQQSPNDQAPLQQPGLHPPPSHAPQPITDMYATTYEDIEMRPRRMPLRRSRSPPPEHSRVRYERRSRSRSPPRDPYGPPIRYHHPEDYRVSRSVMRRPGSPDYVKVYAGPPPPSHHMYDYHPHHHHGRPVYVHEREPPPPAHVVYYESRRQETRHPDVVYYDRPPQQPAPMPRQQVPSSPPSPHQPSPAAPPPGPPPLPGPAGGGVGGGAEQQAHRPIRYAAEPEVLPNPRAYRERDYPYHPPAPPHHPYHPHDYERMEMPRPDPRYVRPTAAPLRDYYASEAPPPEGGAYPPPPPRQSGHEGMQGRYYA